MFDFVMYLARVVCGVVYWHGVCWGGVLGWCIGVVCIGWCWMECVGEEYYFIECGTD